MLKKTKKEKQQEAQINNRMAPLVNMVYALAMAVESNSIKTEVHDTAIKLRSSIHEANKRTSEAFGDWAEQVEERINEVLVSDKLPTLCFLTHKYARKMQDCYRRYDPKFDFYQTEEVNTLKRFADKHTLSAENIKKTDEVIIKAMRE